MESHRTELPIEVVLGTKGSGKTFTFLQMNRLGDWASFGTAAGVSNVTRDTPVISVLAPLNITDGALPHSAEALSAVRTLLRDQMGHELSETGWRRVWLCCFARALGIECDPLDAEERLADYARRSSAIFAMDGLEDLFQDFDQDADQQRALRALLQHCPEWLRTLRGRPLGLLVFVRRDLARAAVRQNFAQFERRHEQFALRWNRTEVLRLASWVCLHGGVDGDGMDTDTVATATADQLSQYLKKVWGDHMGSVKSREANSQAWFLAALSDFKGQIQARDVVTFLATAAEQAHGSRTEWADRVLPPTAMRAALPACSKAKIDEISEENRPLGLLFDRLRELGQDARKLPFQLETVGLKPAETELLEINGVLFREGDQYWIPEIFRHGLGFRTDRRPRVLAVANVVRRRNDLSR